MDQNVAKLTNIEARRLEADTAADGDAGLAGEDRPNEVGGVPTPAPDPPMRPDPDDSLAPGREDAADDPLGDG